MRLGASIWFGGGFITAVTVGVPVVGSAQDFKTPTSISHFVYHPTRDIAELENVRGWTFGLGMMIGLRRAPTEGSGIYGLTTQATYGGAYWYVAGSVGMWNSGSPTSDNFGFGVDYHYNVFQSRDLRTRLGPQFGWSTGSDGRGRTHVWTYRAAMSHALTPSVSFYTGLGASTSRFSDGETRIRLTDPGVLGGTYVRLNTRFAVSAAVEALFSDPLQLTFASSVHFEPLHRTDGGNPQPHPSHEQTRRGNPRSR